MALKLSMPDVLSPAGSTDWFAPQDSLACPHALGFRTAPGGVHLSKTMMLADLASVLETAPDRDRAAVESAVVAGNVLGKPTGSARRLALARLNTLYGILTPLPVQATALRLWPRNVAGRPLLALLCALAREPLLRQTGITVLNARQGSSVRWPDFAAAVEAGYPGRYSPNMLQSLARNCASSWTQSGHLRGKVDKRRSVAAPSPEAAAYAALLGALAGRVHFGGALSGRDQTAVGKTVSGLLKLLHPDGSVPVPDEDLEWAVRLALEGRRRVKEQRKRVGSAEFRNTQFSYSLGPDGVEHFVATPELQSEDSIGGDPLPAGQVWALSPGGQDEGASLYRIEVTESPGAGVRILNQSAPGPFRECVRIAEQNLYGRAAELVGERNPREHEFSVQLRSFDAGRIWACRRWRRCARHC